MVCNKCGKECSDNVSFCTECGNKLVGDENKSIMPVPVTDEEYENGSASPEAAENTEKRRPAFFDDSPTMVLEADELLESEKAERVVQEGSFDVPEIPMEPAVEEPAPANDATKAFPAVKPEDEATKEFTAVKPDQEEMTREIPAQKVPEVKAPAPSAAPQNVSAPVHQPAVPVPPAPVRFDDNSNTMTMQIPANPAQQDREFVNQVRDHISNDQRARNNNYNAQNANNWQIPPNGSTDAVIPPPAAPAPTSKKEKKVGSGRVFGASILAFFAVIFLFSLNLLVCVKFGVTGKLVNKRIQKININTVLNSKLDDSETDIAENLYNTLGFGSLTHGNATVAEFKEYLADTNALEYIGYNAERYLYYIRTNKGGDPSVTSEDIANDFFKENNDVCEDHFGCKLGSEEIDLIEKRLDDEDLTKKLSIKEWNAANTNYALSYVTLGIMAGFVFLLFICICIIVDRKGRHMLMFLGNILLIPGLLTFIVGIAMTIGVMVAYAVTSNGILYAIFMVGLPFGVMLLIAGFAELIFASIFRSIAKKLKRNEKAKKKYSKEQPVPIYS